MKRFLAVLVLALGATLSMMFIHPSIASADSAYTLSTLTPVVMTETAAAEQTDQKPVVRKTWGAVKMLYRGNDVQLPGQTSPQANRMMKPAATPTFLSGGVYVKWPFNYLDPTSAWRGDEGDYSGGSVISNPCGTGDLFSHSLSDRYARDLSRIVGSSAGVPIYASRTGIVIYSGYSLGYGNSVVIWVPGENIQIRYAHLQVIGAWGGYIMQGWYVGRVGNTPGGFSPHLHMAVYRNIPLNSSGTPQFVGNMCRGEQYACPFYFN